jgi:hypothetical protein
MLWAAYYLLPVAVDLPFLLSRQRHHGRSIGWSQIQLLLRVSTNSLRLRSDQQKHVLLFAAAGLNPHANWDGWRDTYQ